VYQVGTDSGCTVAQWWINYEFLSPPAYTNATTNPFNEEPRSINRFSQGSDPDYRDKIITSACLNPEYPSAGDNGVQNTTKELRQLIDNATRSAVIESTKSDLGSNANGSPSKLPMTS
jgi:hypothetical protein